MKILFIIPELHKGGAQSVLLELVKYFHNNSHDNHILYFRDEDEVNPLFSNYATISHAPESFYWKEVTSEIARIKPDIINTHVAMGKQKLFYYLWKTQIPVYITIHSHSNLAGLSLLQKLKISTIQLFSKKIIFVAEYSKEFFKKNIFIHNKNATVICNGVDAPIQGLKLPAFEKDCIHIISVANLRKLKGYQYSLPAIKELVDEFPNLRYHILGETLPTNPTEDSGPWIKKYIEDNNLKDFVILHGSIDNVSDYLAQSDIFLCSSERELLPMSILEAMNCKLPIIATDVGGIREIIGTENQYGILVESCQVSTIKAALTELLSSSSKREFYSKKSIERARDFAVTKMAEKYLSLFQESL